MERFNELKHLDVNQDVMKAAYDMLQWSTYTFDEYMNDLIAPIPLHLPLKNELKLSQIQITEQIDNIESLSLTDDMSSILQRDETQPTKHKLYDIEQYYPSAKRYNCEFSN
ncbi:hypothetical protein QTN25_002632 [Entamoeba marina]